MSFSRSNVMVVRSMGRMAVLANLARSLKRRLDCWMSARSPVPVMAFVEPLEARIALSAAPIEIPGEFLVNTTTGGAQVTPSTASLSTGGYIVTWAGPGAGGSSEIFAQLYSPASNKVGGEFLVNTTTVSLQASPTVARLTNDRFVIVWQSANQDSDSWGIYGQVYNNNGSKVGGEVLMNQTVANSQDTPSVVGLATGGFMVSWESPDGSSDGVYARRFDNDGGAMASQFRVNTTALGDQGSPAMAAMGDGSVVVVWTSAGQDGNLEGVYAQRYDSLGVASGTQFQVNTYTTGSQSQASVAALRSGGFVVAWQGNNNQDGQGTGIFAQRFNSTGVKSGAEMLVNVTTQYNQQAPSVVADASGFIVAWETQEVRGDMGIYGRRFDNKGGATSGEMSYNALKSGDQTGPKVTVLNSNKVVVVWQSQGNDGSVSGIGAVVNGAANAVPTATGIADVGLYDEAGYAVQLTDYFGDAESGSAGLVYTIVSNTNSALLTDLAIDSNGKLTFNITVDASGESLITIRATDNVGQFVEDTFNVTAVQHLTLVGTTTINEVAGTGAFNLFNIFNVPFAARPYLDFSKVTAYSGDDTTKNTTLTKNTLNVELTGLTGTGVFTIDGAVLSTIPIQGLMTLNVLDSILPTVLSISSVDVPTTVDLNHVDVTFSEPIKLDSFDWTSITLTRDGGANLINAGSPLTLELVTGNVYRISGLGVADTFVGKYTLTMLADGVTDLVGNGLASDFSTNWIHIPASPSAPVLAPLSAIAPGSQTTGDATPDVTGTGTPGSTVSIYEGTKLLGSAVVDEARNYTVTLSTLTNRSHTLTATASAIIDSVTYTANAVGETAVLVSVEEIITISQYLVPRTTPVNKFIVVTSAAIDLSTFTVDDITLTRNGIGFPTTGITVTAAGAPYSGFAYAINMPPELTILAGDYVLTVDGTTILTTVGTALTNSITSAWTTEARFTGLTEFPDPRTSSVTTLVLTAGNILDLGTFGPGDYTMTLNGVAVSTAGIEISDAGPGYAPNSFHLNLPIELTRQPGNYVFTVLGAGVQSSGTPVANNFSTSWLNQAQLLTLSQFDTYRTTPAELLVVAATDPIDLASFTAEDITLTYNGVSQPTAGITITPAGPDYIANTYAINIPPEMTQAAGSYVLTVNGIGILSGTVPVANNRTSAWTTETVLIDSTNFPEPRTTPLDTVIVVASNNIDMASFSDSDLVLTRNGVAIPTTGITMVQSSSAYHEISYTLSFPLELTAPAGTYALTLAGSGLTSSGRTVLGSVTSNWTTQASLTSISQFAAQRTTPVTTVIVHSTDALDLSSASTNDLVLTRNGVAIAKDGITITAAGPSFAPNSYSINLPAGLTDGTGTYALTINGAGLIGAGLPVANNLTTGWTTVVEFTGITQYASPRSTPVTKFVVTASQALDLSTFNFADLSLTRAGAPISLAGATVTVAGPEYTAPNSYLITISADTTSANGDYVFMVTGSGVSSLNGDPVANDLSSAWTKA
jgi:hypothetical protein